MISKGASRASFTERVSSNPEALSSNPEVLSSNPPGKFDEALRGQLLDGISGTLAAKVGALGQRHPPQAVRDVVEALCKERAWRVDELSIVLRRNPEVVRQNYLRPLMREGRLTMTNPQEPNDPQQAYRVADGKL